MKGFWQSFWLTAAWLVFVIPYGANPKLVYGPYIGAAFGCFAISIAVQQLYAYSAGVTEQARRIVYFWSSSTLFLLGFSAVMGCLPNFLQLDLSWSYRKFFYGTSAVFLVLGYVTLFRFAAAYLYRGRDVLSDNLFKVFQKQGSTEWAWQLELFHVSVCTICFVLAIWGGTADGTTLPPNAERVADPIYFPFKKMTLIGLATGFYLTAAIIVWFFWAKMRRLAAGEPLDGLLFMAAMGVMYFAPCMVQGAGVLDVDAGFQNAGIWVLLVAFALVLVFLSVSLGEPVRDGTAEVNNNLRALKIALLVPFSAALGLCLLLIFNGRLLQVIPFLYVTLGFLTLACAYLPINDLERLTAQTTPGQEGPSDGPSDALVGVVSQATQSGT